MASQSPDISKLDTQESEHFPVGVYGRLSLLRTSKLSQFAPANDPQSIVKASLITFSCCLVALTLLAWGISLVEAKVFHRGYPFNTPLFIPDDRFSDLTNYSYRVSHLSAGAQILSDGKAQFSYTPTALYALAFFVRLFPDPVIALTAFIVIAAVAGLVVLSAALKTSKKSGPDTGRWINLSLWMTALCAYPFMIMIDRGNIECVDWLFSFLGLVFFIRKRYLASALLFALAVCVKPFPALYFFLFLRRGLYKEIAAAAVTVLAANLIVLKTLGPSISVTYGVLQAGAHKFVTDYVASFRSAEMRFDHSLFSCIKELIRLSLGWPPVNSLHGVLLSAYMVWLPVSALILIACGFWFWSKPALNQLFAIVLSLLLLPAFSGDYTLAALYLPWGMFMIFLVRDVSGGRVRFSLRQCLWVLIPCAVAMTPQSYLTLASGGFAGQVKAVALLLLLFVVAYNDMPSSVFGELQPQLSGAATRAEG
jgi:hypothetical protein